MSELVGDCLQPLAIIDTQPSVPLQVKQGAHSTGSATQMPAAQWSPVVHWLPSSHGLLSGRGVPTHNPFTHLSPWVQLLWSMQKPVSGVCTQSPVALHRSLVHWLPSSAHPVPAGRSTQSRVQQPPLRSPSSQASPSSICPLPQRRAWMPPDTPTLEHWNSPLN